MRILNYLEVECFVDNVRRIGKPKGTKPCRLLFQVHDLYAFKKLTLTAKHLKSYDLKDVYLNCHLMGEEAKKEAAALHTRWKLINEYHKPHHAIVLKHGSLFVDGMLYIDESSTAIYDKNAALPESSSTHSNVCLEGGIP